MNISRRTGSACLIHRKSASLYGMCTFGVTKAVIEQIRNIAREKKLNIVNRDDDALNQELRARRKLSLKNRDGKRETDKNRS